MVLILDIKILNQPQLNIFMYCLKLKKMKFKISLSNNLNLKGTYSVIILEDLKDYFNTKIL